MKQKLLCLALALVCSLAVLSGCIFSSGTRGLQYEYTSLQTAPLVGTFSGMYTVTGITSKSKNVVIPESYRGHSVYHIAENAFLGNTYIQTIVLPTSLIDVKHGAFSGCTSLEKVYYSSTRDVRERLLTVQYDNDELLNAVWYYYSDEQPTEEGNYWRFVNKKVVEW